MQSPTTLPAADAAAVERVEQDNGARIVAKLARRFTVLVRGCNACNHTDAGAAVAELDAWVVEAGRCGVPTMGTFAAGLKKDGNAIRGALTTPWSNGQTEGQVNRLKLIKRQMMVMPTSTCSADAFCLRHDPREVTLVANSTRLR